MSLSSFSSSLFLSPSYMVLCVWLSPSISLSLWKKISLLLFVWWFVLQTVIGQLGVTVSIHCESVTRATIHPAPNKLCASCPRVTINRSLFSLQKYPGLTDKLYEWIRNPNQIIKGCFWASACKLCMSMNAGDWGLWKSHFLHDRKRKGNWVQVTQGN